MAVTFTRDSRTFNATTQRPTTTTTTIVGSAIRVQGDARRYEALGLRETEAPTLLFVPNTYGDTVKPGDRVTWESKEWTVAEVFPLAPDGVTILQKVIIKR